MLKMTDVSKVYPGGSVALQNVDIHIEPGEFVFVVGPSGAGKSTFIKMLFREVLPTTGSIFVNGVDILSLTPNEIPYMRRQLGIIFQDYRLVGLRHRADAYPNELSGGEQQRVAIARAIVNDPIMVIADEPTGNLDPETSWDIMEIFKEINAEGTTIVMATHDKEIVDAMGKRVIAIEDGHIVRDEASGVYGYEL